MMPSFVHAQSTYGKSSSVHGKSSSVHGKSATSFGKGVGRGPSFHGKGQGGGRGTGMAVIKNV
jgi:hypothetical protein